MADVIQIVVEGKDEASGVLSKVGGALGGMASVAGGVLSANLIGGIAGKIKDLAGSMISGNAEFETYQTQFGVLLKSAPAAKERLEELAKFGATTPFELPELVRADKVLTAFGLDSADTAKKFGVSGAQIRTTIGDIASGTGANFEELSVTFGKFASGATGEAISRFQELGIATREEMAGWGLQFSKSGQLLTPTAEAFTVLEKHVRDKFGGMMTAQSQTFSGMVSNLQDWMGQTVRALGAPIFEAVKDKLAGLLAWLPTIQPQIDAFAHALADGIGGAMTWLSGTAIPALVAGWSLLQPALAPIGEIVANLVGAFTDAGATSSEFGEALGTISPTLQVLQGVVAAALPPIQSIVLSVFGIIGGFITEHGAKIQSDLMGAWQAVQGLINAVLPPIQAIVSTVFGAIATFLQAHGAEIQAFLGATWDQIASIVTTAVQLIQAIVVPVFTAIAAFLTAHGAQIQQVLSAAWTIISTVISTVLATIQGVITAALQLIQGNWSGAWQTIQQTCATIVQGIWTIIQAALNGIAAFFGTSLSGIVQLWTNNWNMLVSIIGRVWGDITGAVQRGVSDAVAVIEGLPGQVAGVGAALVDMLQSGIQNAWSGLVATLRGKLQELRNMLPFSEPRDHSSPLFGLSKSGESIVKAIASGILSAANVAKDALAGLASDLLKQIDDLADKARRAMDDALVGGAEGAADIARQRLRAFDDLADLSAAAQQAAQAAMQEAESQTATLAERDPKLAAEFYRMRTDQITELAKLQDDLSQAADDAERARLEAKIKLTEDAQQAERDAFLATAAVKGDALDGQRQQLLAQIATLSQARDAAMRIVPLGAASVQQIADQIDTLNAELSRTKKADKRAALKKQIEDAIAAWDAANSALASERQIDTILPGLAQQLGALPTATAGDVLGGLSATDVGRVSTSVVIAPGAITINGAAGQSVDALADAVIRKLQQQTSARR